MEPWACGLCTLRNAGGAEQCAACGTPRRASSSSAASAAVEAQAAAPLPQISPVSPLSLPCLSPVSPLYLPCISPASPQAQIVRAIVPERTLLFLFNVPEHVS